MKQFEFDYIDEHVLKGKDFSEIKDNMEQINDIALELVKNVLAMILRLESNEKTCYGKQFRDYIDKKSNLLEIKI